MARLDSYNSYILVIPHRGIVLRVEHFGPFKTWDVYRSRHRRILHAKKIKSPE